MLKLAAMALALQSVPQELPAAEQVPVTAGTCAGKLYEAFDFWVGDWSVYAKDGVRLGRSTVTKVNNGCAVRETWLPVQGQPGGNLNAPDLITGRWHQYWVDGSGARVDLEGGLYQGSMILSGNWRRINGSTQDAVLKITYTRLDQDSVRQLAEFSSDDGLTWEVSFDHLYLRVPSGN